MISTIFSVAILKFLLDTYYGDLEHKVILRNKFRPPAETTV